MRLLGQVEIEVDGRPFELATPRKSLQVLSYLLLHRAGPVPRDHLAFLLWPDEEESVARARLRSTINDLQRVLPQPHDDFIGTNADTIWWNSAVDLWFDVDAFLAASKDPSRLDEAVTHYRGELLSGLYDEWLYGVRDNLQNIYLADLTTLIAQKRRRGDLAAALGCARAILAIDPWREDIVRRVMSLRYDAADAAGALHEYREFCTRLRDEMDVAPMVETSALAERIAAGGEVNENEPIAPEPRRRAAMHRFPFVGRAREMARLEELWSRTKQRAGGVAFVSGEPGIGKSRLVDEFMHIVEEGGGRALFGGTGSPEGVSVPEYRRVVTRRVAAGRDARSRYDLVSRVGGAASRTDNADCVASHSARPARRCTTPAPIRSARSRVRQTRATTSLARRAGGPALGKPIDG